MNRHLQELAEQCAHQVYDSRSGVSDKFNIEMFAELIVQECVGIFKQKSSHYYLVGSDYCGNKAEAFDEAIDLVTKHFGVEE